MPRSTMVMPRVIYDLQPLFKLTMARSGAMYKKVPNGIDVNRVASKKNPTDKKPKKNPLIRSIDDHNDLSLYILSCSKDVLEFLYGSI